MKSDEVHADPRERGGTEEKRVKWVKEALIQMEKSNWVLIGRRTECGSAGEDPELWRAERPGGCGWVAGADRSDGDEEEVGRAEGSPLVRINYKL